MMYEPGRDVHGLLATLKRLDPGGVAELKDRGGRVAGKPVRNMKKRHKASVGEALRKLSHY